MRLTKRMKVTFEFLVPFWMIGFLVVLVWQGLEYSIEGKVTHRHVDDIIALILTLSLWFNYETIKILLKQKNRNGSE